ncbi:DUF2637 domain-containing protein [Mycobacterium sp. NPDC050041]|uniref:DUF2637 domain-containing protein n=1 Tax=Mycobacterium sp. NPDC050041 TaxID=3364293 RepID=UPI003C2DFB9E
MSRPRRSLTLTRSAAVLITAGIGIASFVLSFAALRDLAARAGIPAQLAWLWPLIVDGTILQATMAVVVLAGIPDQARSRRYFWAVLTCAAAVSVGANALHAVIPAGGPMNPWLAAAIAVVAPVSLLAATHGLSLLSRIPGPPETDDVETDVGGADSEADATVTELAEEPGRRVSADIGTAARQPWETMAEAIASRDNLRGLSADDVAGVLHLSYERELTPQAIARQLGFDRRAVLQIIDASAELLRSGDVSVERLAV